MKVLFIHQNFPGQFVHLAPELAGRGHQVDALFMGSQRDATWQGVSVHAVPALRGSTPGVHPWVVDLETKVIRAQSVLNKALAMKSQGYHPDLVVAHPGWGESLFIKDVWPKAKLATYCEFNYNESGYDVGFDPEFGSVDETDGCRLRLKNLNNRLHADIADLAWSPTRFQAGTYPDSFRHRITVLHDGIDTDRIIPNSDAVLKVSESRSLTREDEVITFANRNLEPYRGYHVFMRALPKLLKERPRAHVVLVGSSGVSYGKRPPNDQTWKDVFLNEVKPQISQEDWARVHFLPFLARPDFLSFLQVSTVHVYLTYPFVASWSLLEAMSAGCAIVGSDTEPVREFINHDVTGRLAPFFDRETLVTTICGLLDQADLRDRLGRAAREMIVSQYDLKRVCLPRLVQLLESAA